MSILSSRTSDPSTRLPLRRRATAAAASITRLPANEDEIPRLERYNLNSAILPESGPRELTVYLPLALIEEPARRLPVLYLHDGQNLFDPRTSYLPGRTWRAGETADRLAAKWQIEPVILAGIANVGLGRMAEYTPTRDVRMGGGDGVRYGRLIVEEVKPWLDRTYPTLTGPEHTGLGGSSLGGLISLYLGLKHPEIFGRLAVLSPSIWWDHRSILTLVSGTEKKPRPRIWLDIGTAEGPRHVRDTELLYRLLVREGWRDGVDVQLSVVPGGVHDEDAWAARFGDVLRFLFPAQRLMDPP